MEQKNNNTQEQPLPEAQEQQAPDVQRTFIVGDNWLYFKFYCGPKTADIVLTQMIKPLTEQLLANGVIDKWFFIRYGDPKLHIRVRFHVQDTRRLIDIILAINNLAKPYIEESLIWKVQLDSYQREIERYGLLTMEMGETIFFHDSVMITDMLSMIEGDEGERIRWLFGLRTVDALLEDFKYTMEEKYQLVTMLREGFGREHGMNRNVKEQLERKFRRDRKTISSVLDPSKDEDSEMQPLFEMVKLKSQVQRPIAEEILKLYNNEKPNPLLLNDLMGSYSHMMINRLFKTKQRTHEMVLYDFLHRYYKSELARLKYSKINAEKKKAKKKKNK